MSYRLALQSPSFLPSFIRPPARLPTHLPAHLPARQGCGLSQVHVDKFRVAMPIKKIKYQYLRLFFVNINWFSKSQKFKGKILHHRKKSNKYKILKFYTYLIMVCLFAWINYLNKWNNLLNIYWILGIQSIDFWVTYNENG